jgi:hypothetical protein
MYMPWSSSGSSCDMHVIARYTQEDRFYRGWSIDIGGVVPGGGRQPDTTVRPTAAIVAPIAAPATTSLG